MSDHARDSPRGCRMIGRERAPPAQESPLAAVCAGALPARGKLNRCVDSENVDQCLAGKQSCLALVFVLRHGSPEVHSAGGADQRSDAIVRELAAAVESVWRIRQMLADVAVRRQQPCSQTTQRNEPRCVRKTYAAGAGPDCLL